MPKGLTGYPSIDRPWLKYYDEDAINAPLPQGSIYEYLWECNKNHLDDTAISFFGKKHTYGDLFKNINQYATKFASYGIKKGDIVAIISLGTPETIYAIYGLNKIGAVAFMESMAAPPDKFKQSLISLRVETVIILDLAYKKFEDVLHESKIDRIFCLSVSQSMPILAKAMYHAKHFQNSKPVLKMVSSRPPFQSDNTVSTDDPAVIVQTSGTTSIPKKVVLSNLNINSVIFQYQHSGIPFHRGEKFLAIVPPFLAVGLTLQFHLPLCVGVTSYICLDPAPKNVTKQFIKYRPNHFMGGVSHVKNIIAHPSVANMDLSFLTNLSIGGETPSDQVLEETNLFLSQHKSLTQLKTGYGMTELSSSVITERDGLYKAGSVGFPLSRVNIKVIDTDTGDELKYSEQGELLISSPSLMKEYLGAKDETEQVLTTDKDKTKWIHTGDIGYIDKDGFVFITGRLKRIFQALNPQDNSIYKLFPAKIENEIEQYLDVLECAVIIEEDKALISKAIAFISSRGKINVDDLSTWLNRSLAVYEMPAQYIIVDEIPHLPNGKKDYRTLEEMARAVIKT